MTPAQVHNNWLILSSAGAFPSITVGAPGTHGEGVFGMHGIGVRTPKAAAVAAATIGLAGLMHIPKGKMFTMGIWSFMFAAGIYSVFSIFGGGRTASVLGAMPIVHIICTPMHTCNGINQPPIL